MLSAVTITAADFVASRDFYAAVLDALRWDRTVELVDEEEDGAAVEAIGWAPPGLPAQLWLVTGSPSTIGLHLRLMAASRHEVETFTDHAVRHGGTVDSAPRRWTVYRTGEYGATVRDPAGNLLEAVAPE